MISIKKVENGYIVHKYGWGEEKFIFEKIEDVLEFIKRCKRKLDL